MPDAQSPPPIVPPACWRCGAPSQRQGQRSALCLTCLEMLAEITTLHQRPVQASGEEGGHGEDFCDSTFMTPPRRPRVRARW
jgi:hypothetical protein